MPAFERTVARLAFAAVLWAAACCAVAAGYVPRGQCGGLPRIMAVTPPGHCLALVAGATQGLSFPRRLLEVEPGRFWLIDMVSWLPGQGRLSEFRYVPGQPVQLRVLLSSLDRPLGLVKGPDGLVYVGEAGRVWRTPIGVPLRPETVVDGLPADGAHPLKELAFGTGGRLYINVGSFSDACRDVDGRQPLPCPEIEGPRPRAAVWEAALGGPGNTLQSLRPFATGLRNSVALAFAPDQQVLLQGENSIDYLDAAEPEEEINVLRQGGNYGWPYCVAARKVARGYEGRVYCEKTLAPARSVPAHAAPLHLLVVPKSSTSPFAGQVLMALHGHRSTGQRVVSFELDAQGRPGPTKPVIHRWAPLDDLKRNAAPVGLTLDGAGRLWIVDDRNRSLLVLLPDTQ